MSSSINNLTVATEYYRTQFLKTIKRPCCQRAVNGFSHKIIGLLAMSKDDRYREVKEIKEKEKICTSR